MTGLFIIIIAVILWAGFICAISFMESWLKFRAPGLTMPAGLSVVKLVLLYAAHDMEHSNVFVLKDFISSP